ncbi:MAG: TraB/GumN family protein, partial [Nitrospirota bacterium]|nr:TraB/GumN family protein [Nitrospirota bacterium]
MPPIQSTPSSPASESSSDVHVVSVQGKAITLVGTLHVSRESADLVRNVIEGEKPDHVCVELDPRRFE